MRMERLTKLAATAFIIFLFSFTATYLYAVNEGTLTITPSRDLKPGDSLKFSAVFINAAGYPEGDTGYLVVTQEIGGQWISDSHGITMPAKYQSVKVEIESNYVIPKNVKPNAKYCFRLMLDGEYFARRIPLTEPVCLSLASAQEKPAADTAIKVAPVTTTDLIIDYVHIDGPSHAKMYVRNQSNLDAPAAKLRVELSRFKKPPFNTFIYEIPPIPKDSGIWIEVTTEKPIGEACECTVKVCVDSAHSIAADTEGGAGCWEHNFATSAVWD
ncbi:MAG: hypothetical protein A2Y62_02260 [Candidatus Fischerbacteria bacterium RBG_13_37_8]|uniref:Uncharacterized protein n=1 Tax=Candidatus Fischerbacteria bacterium RBG_13_37_8 TaxID=1817863 RepID=A0A1F5VVT4_9BACT|nr:MAG: hypothetical protein A2Y62_02260 [Candidatus Fischerbacteria bacterium RBG_13_37_8]